ncbi:FMN reductase [Bacteroidia bacterium]|nr:FMN reductase [Bacteroidia bacterium]
MKKREFLKSIGLVGATLVAREGVSAIIRSAKTKQGKKVVALNGCPNENGNTAYALSVVGETLHEEQIDFEVIHIGKSDIKGCVACGKCREESNGCVYVTEEEKKWLLAMHRADAIILASPTYFGGIAGTMKSFLDRAFYAHSKDFRYKVGASVVTTPRSGASMTFESLNQYFTIAEMTVASSTYWNNVRGLTVKDLKQDGEGIRTMQNLGKNIAKLI